jgi:hypothetical protein
MIVREFMGSSLQAWLFFNRLPAGIFSSAVMVHNPMDWLQKEKQNIPSRWHPAGSRPGIFFTNTARKK